MERPALTNGPGPVRLLRATVVFVRNKRCPATGRVLLKIPRQRRDPRASPRRSIRRCHKCCHVERRLPQEPSCQSIRRLALAGACLSRAEVSPSTATGHILASLVTRKAQGPIRSPRPSHGRLPSACALGQRPCGSGPSQVPTKRSRSSLIIKTGAASMASSAFGRWLVCTLIWITSIPKVPAAEAAPQCRTARRVWAFRPNSGSRVAA